MKQYSWISKIGIFIFLACFSPTSGIAQQINGNFFSTTQVDPNANTYMYCPTLMYDETIGEFRYYACGGVDGDYIICKTVPALSELNNYSSWYPYNSSLNSTAGRLSYALKPSGTVGTFDQLHSCDPSVLKHNGTYYLYYGGLGTTGKNKFTQIGVATSNNGKVFTRANGGVPIIKAGDNFVVKGAYGIGQPAVVKSPDGFFYMIYTHVVDILPNPENKLRVIRSRDPLFAKFDRVRDFTDSYIGGYSVDMVFDLISQQFIVVANPGNNPSNVPQVRLVLSYFDRNFNPIDQKEVRYCPGWAFGEGVGLLTNSSRQIGSLPEPHNSVFSFVGATWGTRYPNTNWITGPTRVAVFTPIGAPVNVKDAFIDNYRQIHSDAKVSFQNSIVTGSFVRISSESTIELFPNTSLSNSQQIDLTISGICEGNSTASALRAVTNAWRPGTNNPLSLDFDSPVIVHSELKMYPNPSSVGGEVNLVYPGKPLSVDVFDMLGRRLKSLSCKGATEIFKLPLDGISPGIYRVSVNYSDKKITGQLLIK